MSQGVDHVGCTPLGIDNNSDFAERRAADLVLVSLERIAEPYLNPDTNIVDALLYRGKGLDVDTVIVDGEVLLRNKKLTRINKENVGARLSESLTRPLQPHEARRGELGQQLLPHVQKFFESWTLDRDAPHYFYNESS